MRSGIILLFSSIFFFFLDSRILYTRIRILAAKQRFFFLFHSLGVIINGGGNLNLIVFLSELE